MHSLHKTALIVIRKASYALEYGRITLPEYSLLFKCSHMLAAVKLVSVTHIIKKPSMVDSLVLVFLVTWLAFVWLCYVGNPNPMLCTEDSSEHIYIMLTLPFSLKCAALCNEIFISQKIRKSCLNHKCYLQYFHCVGYL